MGCFFVVILLTSWVLEVVSGYLYSKLTTDFLGKITRKDEEIVKLQQELAGLKTVHGRVLKELMALRAAKLEVVKHEDD